MTRETAFFHYGSQNEAPAFVRPATEQRDTSITNMRNKKYLSSEELCREHGWITAREAWDATSQEMLTCIGMEIGERLWEMRDAQSLSDLKLNGEEAWHGSWASLRKAVFDHGPVERSMAIPSGISDRIRSDLLVFRALILRKGYRACGGCRAFWSVDEYLELGYDAGEETEEAFVVMFDGGAVAPLFNYAYEDRAGLRLASEFWNSRGYDILHTGNCSAVIYVRP